MPRTYTYTRAAHSGYHCSTYYSVNRAKPHLCAPALTRSAATSPLAYSRTLAFVVSMNPSSNPSETASHRNLRRQLFQPPAATPDAPGGQWLIPAATPAPQPPHPPAAAGGIMFTHSEHGPQPTHTASGILATGGSLLPTMVAPPAAMTFPPTGAYVQAGTPPPAAIIGQPVLGAMVHMHPAHTEPPAALSTNTTPPAAPIAMGSTTPPVPTLEDNAAPVTPSSAANGANASQPADSALSTGWAGFGALPARPSPAPPVQPHVATEENQTGTPLPSNPPPAPAPSPLRAGDYMAPLPMNPLLVPQLPNASSHLPTRTHAASPLVAPAMRMDPPSVAPHHVDPHAVHASTGVPLLNDRDSRAREPASFAHCDGGQRALAAIGGSMFTAGTVLSLAVVITSLLPLALWAKDLVVWNKYTHHAMSAFVNTLMLVRKPMWQRIIDAAKLNGSACRNAISAVATEVFAEFAPVAHDAFLFAIMIFVWASNDSPNNSLIIIVIELYLRCPHHLVHELMNSFALGTIPTAAIDLRFDPRTSPGFARLDPRQNPCPMAGHGPCGPTCSCFRASWETLFAMCWLALSYNGVTTTHDDAERALGSITITSADHDLMQRSSETVQQLASRFRIAYQQAHDVLHRCGRGTSMLDEFHLANTLLVAALPHIYDHVDDILNEWRWKHALTFEEAEKVLSEAEARCAQSSTQRSAKAQRDAVRSKGAPKPNGNDKYKGNDRRSGRDGKKDGRPAANLAAAGEQTSLKNPYVNATEADTKSWLDNKNPDGSQRKGLVCGNCGNNTRQIPLHITLNCPYDRRDGKPWHSKHRPVKVPPSLICAPCTTPSSDTPNADPAAPAAPAITTIDLSFIKDLQSKLDENIQWAATLHDTVPTATIASLT